MEPNACDARDAEDSEAKFRKTLRMIITLAPKVQCPHEQQVMHEWVERLLQPPCTDEDEERRLEYSRYLLFQLKRGKLHMPFLESPCQGTLRPLDEMLSMKQEEEKKKIEELMAKSKSMSAEDSQSGEKRKSSTRKLSLSAMRKKSMSDSKKVKCKPSEAEVMQKNLMKMLDCFNTDNITLENFMIAIGPHLPDKGKVMMSIISKEQINYKNQVENLYKEKEIKIANELAREQANIPQRYQLAKQRMLSRAMAGLNFIKSKAPGFQYDRWAENPDYLRDMFKAAANTSEEVTDDSLAEWERKTLQMLHDVNYEAERIEEANTDKEKEIQELRAQSAALEQDFNCKKAKLAKKIQELESEKFGYAIANDERDRMIEHLLQDMQNMPEDEEDEC